MAATNAPKNWFIAQDNGMQFISHSFSLVKRADNCLINNNNNNNHQYDCKMNTSKQMRFFNYNVNACKKQIATSSQLVVVDQNQQPPCNISATTTTSATFIIDNHNAIINNCGSNKKKRTTKQNLDNCSGCVNGITKPKKMMKAIHATTPQIEFQFIPCYFTPKGKEKNDNLTCCSSPSNVSCCGSHDEHVALSSPTLSNSSMSNDFINLTVNNSLMGNNDKLIDEKKKLSSCTTTTRRTSISIRELLN